MKSGKLHSSNLKGGQSSAKLHDQPVRSSSSFEKQGAARQSNQIYKGVLGFQKLKDANNNFVTNVVQPGPMPIPEALNYKLP